MDLFIIRKKKIRKTNFPEVWPFLYKNSHNWAAIFLVTLLFILPLFKICSRICGDQDNIILLLLLPPFPSPPPNLIISCVCVRCTEGSERLSAPYNVSRGPAPHTGSNPSHYSAPPPSPISAGQPGGGGARGSAPLDNVQWTATALIL